MTSPSPEKSAKDSKAKSWRAKLYELESTGSWLDQGTGFVLSELQLRGDEPCLVMLSEEDENKTLLTSRIQSDEMYEKQGGECRVPRCFLCHALLCFALLCFDMPGCVYR
ncbi:hypothetical protein EON64_19285 [archaeon]|nr:MAG: hypothetical protein EON64_19285 [archaeon]